MQNSGPVKFTPGQFPQQFQSRPSSSKPANMRKYYRAILFATAIGSLIALLFYRHEYNKLRYVLEVFNYFGKPGSCSKAAPRLDRIRYDFDQPVPAWQRIDDNVYLYSAFSFDREVRAIGIALAQSPPDLDCDIYQGQSLEFAHGEFHFERINVSEVSGPRGYRFICKHDLGSPISGVRFYAKGEKNLEGVPILALRNVGTSLNNSASAICVVPPEKKPISYKRMLEFLNFHEVIGMGNFIVYDFGISDRFNRVAKDLTSGEGPYGKFTYTTLPWNFPFMGVPRHTVEDLVRADCLYRTFNAVMYAVALSWDDYVVLKYHHMMVDLMLEFQSSKLEADRFRVPSTLFCREKEDEAADSLKYSIFLNTNSLPESDVGFFDIYKSNRVLKESPSTHTVLKDLLVVQKYRDCGSKGDPSVLDKSIQKFQRDVESSVIYKNFSSGRLF